MWCALKAVIRGQTFVYTKHPLHKKIECTPLGAAIVIKSNGRRRSDDVAVIAGNTTYTIAVIDIFRSYLLSKNRRRFHRVIATNLSVRQPELLTFHRASRVFSGRRKFIIN